MIKHWSTFLSTRTVDFLFIQYMKLHTIMYPEPFNNRVLFLFVLSIHDCTLTSGVIVYSFLLKRRLKNPFLTCAGSVSFSVSGLET